MRLASAAWQPIQRFMQLPTASGMLLLAMAVIAMVLANSSFASDYAAMWQTPVGLHVGPWHFERSLEWLVNDVLMVIFFFVVGLEIRRELDHGELSQWRRAALPAGAALGGMLAPAAIYLMFAGGDATRSGWGVPMATDIAFAVGVLALLGKRVPPALRVLLLALAVIDDLGAIVVIAIFYSQGVAVQGFVIAAGGLLLVLLLQRFGVRAKAAYVLPGVVVWAGIYNAGVHPTIAGVILGLITPVRAWWGVSGFKEGVRQQLHIIDGAVTPTDEQLRDALHHVDHARREAIAPGDSLVHMLSPWVSFGIMPLFALANAGVAVSGVSFDGSSLAVICGVAVGLVVGKPIGVLLACALMIKTGIGTLPQGLGVRHLVVLGVVAGVGFTMALFVAALGFTSPQLLAAAKLGVLGGSVCAAVLGVVCGPLLLPNQDAQTSHPQRR
jgi:Na+:H+ antiporter, NhaA family